MDQICPYNVAVECTNTSKCHRCGWNPEVAQARLRELAGGAIEIPPDKLYKVPFTGYCEVWANSPEEALDRADDDKMFFVSYNFGTPECLSKEERNEVD